MLLKLLFFGVLCLCTNAQSVDNLEVSFLTYNFSEYGATVHLENSGLESLHPQFVSGDRIKYLKLQNNKITRIENSAFDSLPNLQYINLMGNKLNYINFLNGNKFSNLKTLILDRALVNVEDGNNECESEDCDKILSISTEFPQLQHLYLRENNLTSLNISSWKKHLPKLTHLILSHNELKTIDFINDESFALTHLWLDHNQIDLFFNVPLAKMIQLHLDYNKFYTLCEANYECNGIKLKGAKNLEYLSLSNVELTYIYPNSLVDLENLRTLDLSYNSLSEIDQNVFKNTKNLRSLMIQKNEISKVPNLCSLKNLSTLFINNNKITRIDRNTFPCDIPKLNYLIISHNRINFIDSGAFATLSSLNTLSLAGNQLNVLPDNWIAHNNNLQSLYLSSNLFTDISSMKLHNMTKLRELSIARNSFKFIQVKELRNIPSEDLDINLD